MTSTPSENAALVTSVHQPVLAIMGPTASGKTQAVLEFAQYADIEVVSVDSGQVYRGMDIGTAKPSIDARCRPPHWLLDLCEPHEVYSAAAFFTDALQAIADIQSRNKLPVLVGGSMFYFNVLEKGLPSSPGASQGIRDAIASEAQTLGWPALHERIARLDPIAARRIGVNDAQRIQRALEIIAVTGKAVPQRLPGDTGHLRLAKISLAPGNRRVLHDRISQRAICMMKDGLIDEVKALIARDNLDLSMPSMRAVGYRQVYEGLSQGMSENAMLERIMAATRQLAKRQLTWLRGMSGVTWCLTDHPKSKSAFFEYLQYKLPSLK